MSGARGGPMSDGVLPALPARVLTGSPQAITVAKRMIRRSCGRENFSVMEAGFVGCACIDAQKI